LQSIKYGIVACFFAATSALAQSTAVRTAADAPALISKAPASSNLLRALDSSFEAVISKAAVVQIVVNGYGPSEDHGNATARVVRQHAIGTGIIVDSDGYIIIKRTTFITRMKKLGIDPKQVSERKVDSTDASDSSDASTVQDSPLDLNSSE
jgi:hypothetical protein